ncbi:histidine triad nucleotide-binding protein [soil metagenome]
MARLDSCIFCRIATKAALAKIAYEDDRVIAFHDAAPQAPFHVLVIPRTHVVSLAEADDPALLGHLLTVAARIARDAGLAERGFRVATNTGPDGGQAVPHLHFHVLAGRPLGLPVSPA